MAKNRKRNNLNKLILNTWKKNQAFQASLNAIGVIRNKLAPVYFDKDDVSCAIFYNDLGKRGKYLMPIFCFKMTKEDMRKGFKTLCINKLKNDKGEKISKNKIEILKNMQGMIAHGLKKSGTKHSNRSIAVLLGRDKKTVDKYSKVYSVLSKPERDARYAEAITLKKIPDVDVCDMRTISMGRVEPFLSTKGIVKSGRKLRHKTNQ